MSLPGLIVGLYPPAVRERWGEEIVAEATEAGPRAWPDVAAGAARLWIHPGDWPELVAGQTRRVVLVALCAVTVCTLLLLRATVQSPGVLSPGVDHPGAVLWCGLVAAGLLVAAPLPRLTPGDVVSIVVAGFRTLAVPMLALFAMFVAAHSGAIDSHPPLVVNGLLVAWYWATLCLAGICACRFAARVGRIARPVGTRRLQAGLGLLGAGLAVAAMEVVVAGASRSVGTIAAGVCLAILAAASLAVAHDLWHAHG